MTSIYVAIIFLFGVSLSEAIECPQVTCFVPCESGYRNDSKGCQTCECVDPCEYPKCERGQTCVKEDVICKKEPCYPKYKCIKRCPLINCFVPCKSGYRNDSNGCQTCTCVDPCEYPKCKRGEICQVQIVQCFAPPCYPEYECIKECPKLKCHPCDIGFIYHQSGCQTCECIDPKVHPCKSIRCSRDKICRAVVAPCFNPPCPIIGRCYNSKPI